MPCPLIKIAVGKELEYIRLQVSETQLEFA